MAARLMPALRFRAIDVNTGEPLVGGFLHSYVAGSSTPQNTYSDSSGSTPNTNPVVLDANGEAEVWLGTGAYKFLIQDMNAVEQYTIDNVNVPTDASIVNLTVTGTASIAGAMTCLTIAASGQITSSVASGTAPLVIASTTKVANLNADKLDDKDWAEPAAIGVTTPSSGKFTTLEATGQVTENVTGVMQDANGGLWKRGFNSEEITLSTGGVTTDSVANLLPADAILEAVVARVTQAITTATDWKLGDGTTAARFCAAQSGAQLSLGATVVGLAHQQGGISTNATGPVQSAAAKVRVTTTGTPGAGKIRVTVWFRQFVAPTS